MLQEISENTNTNILNNDNINEPEIASFDIKNFRQVEDGQHLSFMDSLKLANNTNMGIADLNRTYLTHGDKKNTQEVNTPQYSNLQAYFQQRGINYNTNNSALSKKGFQVSEKND